MFYDKVITLENLERAARLAARPIPAREREDAYAWCLSELWRTRMGKPYVSAINYTRAGYRRTRWKYDNAEKRNVARTVHAEPETLERSAALRLDRGVQRVDDRDELDHLCRRLSPDLADLAYAMLDQDGGTLADVARAAGRPYNSIRYHLKRLESEAQALAG